MPFTHATRVQIPSGSLSIARGIILGLHPDGRLIRRRLVVGLDEIRGSRPPARPLWPSLSSKTATTMSLATLVDDRHRPRTQSTESRNGTTALTAPSGSLTVLRTIRSEIRPASGTPEIPIPAITQAEAARSCWPIVRSIADRLGDEQDGHRLVEQDPVVVQVRADARRQPRRPGRDAHPVERTGASPAASPGCSPSADRRGDRVPRPGPEGPERHPGHQHRARVDRPRGPGSPAQAPPRRRKTSTPLKATEAVEPDRLRHHAEDRQRDQARRPSRAGLTSIPRKVAAMASSTAR